MSLPLNGRWLYRERRSMGRPVAIPAQLLHSKEHAA
jgi:hypothetical protein